MNASELRATAILGAIFALRMLGLFMIIPVFSIYGRDYDSSTPMLIGLAVGIYGLAQAFLQIPVSMLAERFDRKKLIIIGLLMFALGGAVAATATDIWQVIIGRLLAGAGAISAVIMALLADVTREQSRSKAMATMGMLIGGSIFLAFILGPLLVAKVGISGLFWLTSVAGLVGIGLIFLVPTPVRSKGYFYALNHSNTSTSASNAISANKATSEYNQSNKQTLFSSFKQLLSQALAVANVKQLYWSVFTLHLLMTAIFVLIPIELEKLGYAVSQHALFYLPLLVVGFILAIPLIIIAEAKRKMRVVFILAMAMIALGLLVVMLLGTNSIAVYGLGIGLAVFFIGFNLLEALIPSWLSKQAPIPVKNTVMGVSSSSQFFGAFLGGTLGGILLQYPSQTAWLICTGVAIVGVIVMLGIGSPPYLSSLTVNLSQAQVADHEHWQRQILDIQGVKDMVVLANDDLAYIKIDKAKIDDTDKEKLTNLIKQKLDI